MKLWQKNISTDQLVENFTVGNDRELDLVLAPHDALASIAHVQMLATIHLVTNEEAAAITKELQNIYREALAGRFEIQPECEDVHSQIEFLLTQRLGEMGKKVHSGRSRNDQVLVALKLYYRAEIEDVVHQTKVLFDTLINLSDKHKAVLMPGYTHMQVAMAVSYTHLSANLKVVDAKTEQLVNPMGLDILRPRFSWILESTQKNTFQTAYEITIAIADDFNKKSIYWMDKKNTEMCIRDSSWKNTGFDRID